MYMAALYNLESALLIEIHKMNIPTAGKTLLFRVRSKSPLPGLTSQHYFFLFNLLVCSSQVTQSLNLFIYKMRLRIVPPLGDCFKN